MKSLYIILDIGSFIVPFIFSFHPKIRFDKEWKSIIPGIILSMVFYLVWDVWFTATGVWGFNPDYLLGIQLFGLPLEEILFFIAIPYACLFTHHCLTRFFESFKLSTRTLNIISFCLLVSWLVALISFSDRAYSRVNFTWAIILISLVWRFDRELLRTFFISFVVILVPFIIVNGILTGTGLDNPIVWYNNAENMGIRFISIPIEDFTYALTMLVFPLFIARRLKKQTS